MKVDCNPIRAARRVLQISDERMHSDIVRYVGFLSGVAGLGQSSRMRTRRICESLARRNSVQRQGLLTQPAATPAAGACGLGNIASVCVCDAS